MSRLSPLDKALVLILVPLWVVCFALALKTQVHGGGYTVAYIGLSLPDADQLPRAHGGVQPGSCIGRTPSLASAGLRVGDRLVAIMRQADLRGLVNARRAS